jgi:hypothetical protein
VGTNAVRAPVRPAILWKCVVSMALAGVMAGRMVGMWRTRILAKIPRDRRRVYQQISPMIADRFMTPNQTPYLCLMEKTPSQAYTRH